MVKLDGQNHPRSKSIGLVPGPYWNPWTWTNFKKWNLVKTDKSVTVSEGCIASLNS